MVAADAADEVVVAVDGLEGLDVVVAPVAVVVVESNFAAVGSQDSALIAAAAAVGDDFAAVGSKEYASIVVAVAAASDFAAVGS